MAIDQELVHRGIPLTITVNGKEKETNIREKVKQLQQHEAMLQDKTMEDVKTFAPKSEADFQTDVPCSKISILGFIASIASFCSTGTVSTLILLC